jgi:2-dehydro-3-deoxyphosphogalactonate aldolase
MPPLSGDTPANPPFRLPLLAILRGVRPEEAHAHLDALVAEGFDAIEIPLNSPDWATSVGGGVRDFGTQAWIGGGTVLHETQVDALQQLGARFIVTPNTRPALIRHAVASGLQVVAGFASASEAFAALDAGAQMLKLFPASSYGPSHVRALRAVLPPVPLFAVGGISPDALPSFLAAGCNGVGIGGELYRPGQTPDSTRSHARTFKQAYLEATR